MIDLTIGVLSLVGGLLSLAGTVVMERDRRRGTNRVSPLLPPTYALLGLGFVINGIINLSGGDSGSWPDLVATLLIVVGGFGSFFVAVTSKRRRRSR